MTITYSIGMIVGGAAIGFLLTKVLGIKPHIPALLFGSTLGYLLFMFVIKPLILR